MIASSRPGTWADCTGRRLCGAALPLLLLHARWRLAPEALLDRAAALGMGRWPSPTTTACTARCALPSPPRAGCAHPGRRTDPLRRGAPGAPRREPHRLCAPLLADQPRPARRARETPGCPGTPPRPRRGSHRPDGLPPGPWPRPLLAGDRDAAREALHPAGCSRREPVRRDQHHLYREDAALVAALASLAEDGGVPLVATNASTMPSVTATAWPTSSPPSATTPPSRRPRSGCRRTRSAT